MNDLYPRTFLHQGVIAARYATRFINKPRVMEWRLPQLTTTASDDTIVTEGGIDILTEDGDTLVTE